MVIKLILYVHLLWLYLCATVWTLVEDKFMQKIASKPLSQLRYYEAVNHVFYLLTLA